MGLLPQHSRCLMTCVQLAWVYYPNTHLSDTCALLAWDYYPNTHLYDTCVLLAWVYSPKHSPIWYLCTVSMGLLPQHSPVWYLCAVSTGFSTATYCIGLLYLASKVEQVVSLQVFGYVVHRVPDQGVSPSNRLYRRGLRVQLPPSHYRLQTYTIAPLSLVQTWRNLVRYFTPHFSVLHTTGYVLSTNHSIESPVCNKLRI